MTTKKGFKSTWTALAWLAGLLTLGSCSKEASSTADGADLAQSSRELSFSLGATLGIELGDLEARAISLSLNKNSKGQLVPKRKAFEDGEKVPVHTAIRNAAGTAYGVKTIEWTYIAKDKQLRLMQTDAGNDIIVKGNFNEGDEWFVAGVIGGNLLNDKEVAFAAKRVLSDTQAKEGQELSNLVVPYAFPWTAMTAETHKAKEENSNLHKYHYAGTLKPGGLLSAATFKPQGFVITAKLGNKTLADLKMEGFTIQTNAFIDNGFFDFASTESVSNGTEVAFKVEAETCPIEYSFDGEVLLSKQVPEARTYYLWAYPTEAGKTGKDTYTKVAMYGENQAPLPKDHTPDYTRTYLVDHISQTDKSYKSAKVYNLPINATTHVRLPIEYATYYDLAGGHDNGIIQKKVVGGTATSEDAFVPAMVRGPLRFANRQADGSERTGFRFAGGAYNHYYVADQMNQHDIYNPQGLKIRDMQIIDEDGNTVPFSSKYRIPDHDDLWGVYPRFGGSPALDPYYSGDITWGNTSNSIAGKIVHEEIKIGEGIRSDMALMQYYSAEWNAPRLLTTVRRTTARVVTAIRLQKAQDACTTSTLSKLFYNEDRHVYSPAPNNRLRSAYRYTLYTAPSIGSVDNGGTRSMLIEVVHLGDAPVTAAEIDQDSWWEANRDKALVAEAFLSEWAASPDSDNSPSGDNSFYSGGWSTYWGRNLFMNNSGVAQGTRVRNRNFGSNIQVQGSNIAQRSWLLSVRPFFNNAAMAEMYSRN